MRKKNGEFDANGYLRRREASIDDATISADERRIFGPRHRGDLTELRLR